MIPKFRAWDVHNKKMLVVNDICNLFWENTFFECYELVPDPKGKREYELIDHRIDFEDCVLMRSTGVLDKNGKEIFEGDVVNIFDEKLSKIYFSEGAFCVEVLNGGTPLHVYLSEHLELIGNIYENPELLEHPDFREG